MDVTDILDPLNEAQRAAVGAPSGNILVLAGAGSGKTRVLVHRIAWLIRAQGVSPLAIMAVTFTNKAANEMRGRIGELLGTPTSGMWVGTFHGVAHRLLRAHWREVDLPQTFQIIDSEDQRRAVRRIIRELGLDETRWTPKQAQGYINARKDEGQRPQHIEDYDNPYVEQLVRIYTAYEDMCRRAGLVDFAELLLRAHELWLKRQDILDHYRQRFRHIMVDEFQDTNAIQYAWVRLLAGGGGHVFVVGDDDQSIYGWRGARIENIHKVEQDFPHIQTVRLEQNYRSSGNILQASNALIACNSTRLGKKLWTNDASGELIFLYTAFNEMDEARFIVERIQQWVEQGGKRGEAAMLYRSNAQSRALEEALLEVGMPYRVYGGLRFFERVEIKDALAYLRLTVNRADDAAFERVVNMPARGIGERSMEQVRLYAKQHGISLWQATHQMVAESHLNARSSGALGGFLQMIDKLDRDSAGLDLGEQIQHVLQHSTLLGHYENDSGEKAQMRVENLKELVSAAGQYAFEQQEGLGPLSVFLAHAALEAGEGQADEWEDCVQLMTMHAAKGLEFPLVFICGMEEKLFPHEFSMDDPNRLEEERRLCYVAMTRAMKQLYMIHAESRRLHGSESYRRASRFLSEIPPEFIQTVRMQGHISPPAFAPHIGSDSVLVDSYTGLKLGQRVLHKKFGEGTVLQFEGDSRHARVEVKFDGLGAKWLVAAYANLQAIQ